MTEKKYALKYYYKYILQCIECILVGNGHIRSKLLTDYYILLKGYSPLRVKHTVSILLYTNMLSQ